MTELTVRQINLQKSHIAMDNLKAQAADMGGVSWVVCGQEPAIAHGRVTGLFVVCLFIGAVTGPMVGWTNNAGPTLSQVRLVDILSLAYPPIS